jgi:hypothetical protein
MCAVNRDAAARGAFCGAPRRRCRNRGCDWSGGVCRRRCRRMGGRGSRGRRCGWWWRRRWRSCRWRRSGWRWRRRDRIHSPGRVDLLASRVIDVYDHGVRPDFCESSRWRPGLTRTAVSHILYAGARCHRAANRGIGVVVEIENKSQGYWGQSGAAGRPCIGSVHRECRRRQP